MIIENKMIINNPLQKDKSWEILIELLNLENNADIRLRTKKALSERVKAKIGGGSTDTFKNRFNELEKAGLIRIDYEQNFPFSEYVYLTEKGRKIAEYLLQIKKIMEENGPE